MSKAKKSKASPGVKPPVMMIHGGFCGPWVWDGFAEKFEAAGYTVHRPALRFHDTAKPPAALGTTSLIDYAADLDAAMDDLKSAPILVGHSLGGLLAQMLAARRPVKACILLAPSAPWGVPPSTLFEIGAAQAMLLQPGFWAQILAPDAIIAGWHFLDRYSPAEQKILFRRFGPESGRATFEMMHWGLDMSRASEVDARKVDCPLLLLAGTEDRIHPPGTVERIAALYGDLATFEKCHSMSHWLIGEPGWEKVAARALEWLEGV
jgi:pimeloyl-ACP methyl ester carboxylesterase